MGVAVVEEEGDCGGCCGVGRVFDESAYDDASSQLGSASDDGDAVAKKQWLPCSLKLAQICRSELVPQALRSSSSNGDGEEVKCAWLRSQVIGSDGVMLNTPFGQRELSYADFTASGRCVAHIEEFMARAVMPLYGNTHAEDSSVGDATSFLVAESARYLRSRLGASAAADALLFCGAGCTSAVKRLQEVMGIAVPSLLRRRLLSVLDENERWVVFIGPYEHHSNLLSWRQSLAEVVEVPLDKHGLLDLDFLQAELQNPRFASRPKLGSFSACSNVSGILTDTRRIARLLHQHGAYVCFDFASCAPYVDIDMRSGEEDGYDALVLSPHKFVGGPGSPGLLLLNKKLYLLKELAPSNAGGGAVDFVNGYTEEDTLYLKDVEAREDAGTPPILQKIKAALAFWLKEEMGAELIESREQYFITSAIKRLSANPNIDLLGNIEAKRVAILSFNVLAKENEQSPERKRKILQGRVTVKLLNDLFGIQARGGCACAGPYGHALLKVDHRVSLKLRDAILKGYGGLRLGWARLNFAYFISHEEFEFILSAIEFIAEYGQRFIPLYDFNWRSGSWTFKPELRSSVKEKLSISSFAQLGVHSVNKYERYLEDARAIAKGLPEFPAERDIPPYIDLELVDFKV